MKPSRNVAVKAKVPVIRGEHPLQNLQADVNRLFNTFFGDIGLPAWERFALPGFAPNPAVDISETEKGFKICAELPGLDAGDMQLTIAEGFLTLKGEKTQESTTEDNDFVRRERTYGSFRKVIGLPGDADIDTAEAELKNGVLTVNLARKADAGPSRREINIREVA